MIAVAATDQHGASGAEPHERSGEYAHADNSVNGLALRALGQGAKTLMHAGRILDDDSRDVEEKRREIEAREAAQNVGALVGLAAGVALGVAGTHKQQEEQARQEQQLDTMTQSM